MKKFIKVVLIIVMLVGIAISLFNFMSVEIKAVGKGTWALEPDGRWICKGDGPGCDVLVK